MSVVSRFTRHVQSAASILFCKIQQAQGLLNPITELPKNQQPGLLVYTVHTRPMPHLLDLVLHLHDLCLSQLDLLLQLLDLVVQHKLELLQLLQGNVESNMEYEQL